MVWVTVVVGVDVAKQEHTSEMRDLSTELISPIRQKQVAFLQPIIGLALGVLGAKFRRLFPPCSSTV